MGQGSKPGSDGTRFMGCIVFPLFDHIACGILVPPPGIRPVPSA